MLLKGISEVAAAARPLAAAEMVLVRIGYAADLPTPDELIRSLDGNAPAAQAAAAAAEESRAPLPSVPRFEAPSVEPRGWPRAAAASMPSPDAIPDRAAAEPGAAPLLISRFEDLIGLASEKRDLGIKLALERDVRLVHCEEGRLEIRLEPSAAKSLVNDLARKLSQWTNRRWMVVVSTQEGEPTIKSQNDVRNDELKTGVRVDPLVQAVLARFPGAEIVDVRKRETMLTQGRVDADSDDDAAELSLGAEDGSFLDAQFPERGGDD
jgi:DNA polymerase-3 subunit gamma/tau